jgi:uncharacterized YccA/Bax inhibitor family protein
MWITGDAAMRSANPTLKPFQQPQTWDQLDAAQRGIDTSQLDRPNVMTIGGTVNAAMILVGLCAAAGLGGWMVVSGQPGLAWPIAIGGFLSGLLLSLVITFKPRSAPVLAPVYAIAEGAFLGAFSLIVAHMVGGTEGAATGIIFQAVILTFGILFSLLLAFRAGLVRIGSTFKRCMVAALGGVLVLFVAGLLINLLGGSFPMFYELFGFGQVGLIGIGFSVFLVVLASLFLVLDFQLIEEGVKAGAPRHMEWYGGFALLVTLVWLYFEILRLLAKLRASAD